MKKKGVVIIGSGNVADALASAISLCAKDYELLQIMSRNEKDGRAIAYRCGCTYGHEPFELMEAELYLIAVSDSAIESVSGKYNFGGATVAHTAGSVDIESLSAKIHNRAVFYPLQTLTKGRKIDFSHLPILIEGKTPAALDTVKGLAGALSDNVSECTSEKRAQTHLAAVFASNFVNHMYVIAEDLLTEAGLSSDFIKPLMEETARKAMDSQSAHDAQTGPAIRNDFVTKSKHCEMLRERADYKNLYINLSKSIWETSRKR